ncbi:hypothetical protein IP70_13235 [alpha proteobacterium AAP38]|nr:hypothetical protein IP70_13235 [alpha proteobacterium AAP38]
MTKIRNPHFDDNRVVWSDEYSGQYMPISYDVQFDDQWRLFLERAVGFHDHTGVEISDDFIDDRIFELTGVRDYLATRKGVSRSEQNRDIGGRLYLEPKFPITYFEGKRCLDIGCGAGRWTKTLKSLGGQVKSTDVSRHGLESTRRVNDDVEALNLFDIIDKRPDLHGFADFTLCWGVLMCTHDPYRAFQNVAATVRPGGECYIMVYAPTYHASEFVLSTRRRFHQQARSNEEKLAFAYEISDVPENAINLLDMLNTFYNWVIPQEVAVGWFEKNGFEDVIVLNRNEPHNCGWHIKGRKKY